MSEILDAAKRFKAELLQQNDAALNQMAKAYAETWTRLKSRLDALTAKINDARKNGEKFSIDWLFRQQRYQELMTQCETEIINFSRDTAMPIIRQQQQLSLDFGEQHSLSLMKTSLGPVPDAVREAGLSVSWNQVPKKALENIVGFLGDGSPLAYKFAGLPSAVKDGIKNAIIAGMAAGQNPQVIARTVRREYAGGLSNAVTVCRTEAMRAYRTASHENYRANDDVVEGWIWSAGHSSRTCAACWGMDGTLHPLDEDLNDHVRGRCCAVPQTKSWQELFPDLDLSDVKETRAEPWDPEEHFKRLTPEQQRKVLGKAKYEAWLSGNISLRDIPVKVKSEVWGDQYRAKTLEELKITHNPLPNYSKAVIPEEKFTKYLLDPTSERGKHKAIVYQSALGYNLSNSSELIEQIRSKINKYPAYSKGVTEHGHKYEIPMPITGPNGHTKTIRTIWIFDNGSDYPRLINALVAKKEKL